ncbi:aryl sulfotransferase [Campylobacter sp. JMF_02 ED1]|uniref:aryl sulfotransferase n=1 Tax=unclassified Campylobacter TaxID=2593542 RepID=UPI0022E9A963|nr:MULTISPECIES: aryl sulfotransferase [unclassified Campylobacter]MDA3049187.1 aryl sulfotransferase [Campylobacter sp. JMF_15 NE4]MDA3051388.1 aryl sulfotransferase [Campylobacter sp. JMF_02 ED1]
MSRLKFIVLAIISAFMATLCCLPALLFLLFGVSFSALSFTDELARFRPIFTAISIVFYITSLYFVLFRKNSCVIGAGRKKWYFIYILSGILIFLLLFYPEILGRFYA